MIAARALLAFCLMVLPIPAGAADEELPDTMPPPAARPAEPKPEPAPPVGQETEGNRLPAEEVACRARLHALGVSFAEHDPIDEPEGCKAPFPLTVSELPGGVALRPDAVLTCKMAEATARFVLDQAVPLTRKEFGSDIAAINQASSYVCRSRNGTSKLSEHAFANALDWASLELEDGTAIEVRAFQRSEPRRARLISALREAACGPFKTVLGPGSDADHADHFHFDLAERRGGGTFCQ